MRNVPECRALMSVTCVPCPCERLSEIRSARADPHTMYVRVASQCSHDALTR